MKLAARHLLAPEQIPLWMLLISLCGVGASLVFSRGVAVAQLRELPERPRIQWLPAADTDRFDPSLMSLPSARGFSSKLWGRSAPVTPQTTEWKPAPSYFDGESDRPLPTLLTLPALANEVQATAMKMPVEAEGLPEETIEIPAPLNRTVIRVTGALADRRVLEEPVAVTVRSEVTLRPTRVRVGVNTDGRVRFATVERSSGDAAVDGRATELARQVRFEPRVTGAEVEWGLLRFLWAQATGTNGVAGSK
jgi:TonB family protein